MGDQPEFCSVRFWSDSMRDFIPNLFALTVLEVDCIGNPDPHIEEAKAGDNATSDAVECEDGEMRIDEEQMVVAPETCPGKDNDDESKIESDDDTDRKLNVFKPERNLALGRLAAFARRLARNLFRRFRRIRRPLGKQSRLLRHQ